MAEVESSRIVVMKKKRRGFSSQAGAICLGVIVVFVSFSARSWASQSVTLAWNAETNAAGYALYYGTNSGSYTSNYTSRMDVGTNTSATVSGLNEGKTYYFAITAYNSQGVESAPSSPITYLVPGLLTMTPAASSAPVTIKFPVAPGHTYTVQASTNLITWSNIWVSGTATSNAWVSFQDTNSGSFKRRYYRLSMSP